ncbi:MAG TPA: polysaccharide biosynthesis tyrosine autokinase [Propionibacteriaceae bacterium]
MDLQSYLAAIRKGWLLLLATIVLGVGAGAALFLTTPAQYATTVDFYVSTPKTEGTNPQSSGQFAEARVNSYIALLSSDQLAKRVIESTGLDLTPQQLAGKVTASAQINTVIVNATVTDSSPARSLQIAQGVADNFGRMVDQLDNAGRSDAIVVINVVSGPTLNNKPVSPDPRIYIGGGLAAGVLIGLAVVIIRELLDTSVRTVDTAQRLVGAPVIGNIVYDAETKRSPLIIGQESTSVRAESFRHLRTNLQFIDAANSANVILVTSAVGLEGKTSTAVNLAMTFVEFGERVLIIDADLRRPKVADMLELPREIGLTNVLAGQAELSDVIQQWGDSNLYLLASGSAPPNPSELLGSSRMIELVAGLKDHFDKIVIDSPPVLPVTDAVVAASLAEAVVLVIRHGKTGRGQVAAATRSLDNVGARVVGSVLNMRRTGRAENRRYGTHQLPGGPSDSLPKVAPMGNMGPTDAKATTTATQPGVNVRATKRSPQPPRRRQHPAVDGPRPQTNDGDV